MDGMTQKMPHGSLPLATLPRPSRNRSCGSAAEHVHAVVDILVPKVVDQLAAVFRAGEGEGTVIVVLIEVQVCFRTIHLAIRWEGRPDSEARSGLLLPVHSFQLARFLYFSPQRRKLLFDPKLKGPFRKLGICRVAPMAHCPRQRIQSLTERQQDFLLPSQVVGQ
jgi:hypothetical protein